MNLSCTVVFVTNMPSIMSTIATTILHGIPMMGTHPAMILIKNQEAKSRKKRTLLPFKKIPEQLLDAPEQLQKPQNSSRTTFAT